MLRQNLLRLLTASLLAMAFAALAPIEAMAQDPGENDDETEAADWSDRDRLAEIVARDEERERAQLEQALADGEISQEDFDLAIAALDEEIANAETLIAEELTDDQVRYLNQFLNDTYNNGRILFLDAVDLQRIIDEDLGREGIRLLTKALEEEAKFLTFAERAEDRYEATGNEKFLDKADRFRQRADSQKTKFLARIDIDEEELSGQALEPQMSMATAIHARNAAKEQARLAARDEARGQAKAAAKKAAKEAAKEHAKDAAKGKGKNR